jgi:hypothetical protein
MSEYDRLLRHGPNGQETIVPPGEESVHTRHCFEYLRQSVLCNLDMTLEGTSPDMSNGVMSFPVCKKRKQVFDWMEANALPGENWVMGTSPSQRRIN